jgi:predicted ATPase/DNA-binding winged helix-turn-helix (wHTH) protein
MSESSGPDTRCWQFRRADGQIVTVDARARRVMVGSGEVDLDPRGTDLLIYFLRNPQRPLLRNELISGAWNLATLELTTVTSHVRRVRRAIGLDAIVTVNGGYQFAPDVVPVGDKGKTPVGNLMMGAPLPSPPTALIGRAEDLGRLLEMCRRGTGHLPAARRSIQLIGPGGVGKTALVLEAVRNLQGELADGVIYVDLARANSIDQIVLEVGRAFGLAMVGRAGPRASAVASQIGGHKLVLVLDTCDYVVNATAQLIASWVAACPNLVVIAVSQQVLLLDTAAMVRLLPLQFEDAVALFKTRVSEASDGVLIDQERCRSICKRIDGLPLIIEMAAARFNIGRLGRVLDSAEEPLDILAIGQGKADSPGTIPGRQRDLQSVLVWSHGLLRDDEQKVFRRLAVFAGSISPEAADAILRSFSDSMAEWQLLELVGRLAECSLIIASREGEPRFRFLDSVREYAAAKLVASGESELAADAHARYFIARFQRAERDFETMSEAKWRATYAGDLDDLRRARDQVGSRPERLVEAVDLICAAGPLWLRLGFASEVRQETDRLLDLIGTELPKATEARLYRIASMLWRQADRRRALVLCQRASVLFREIEEAMLLAKTLTAIGEDQNYFGCHHDARIALIEAVALLPSEGVTKTGLRALNELGVAALALGDVSEANVRFSAARQAARQLGDKLGEAIILFNLGEVEFRFGSVDYAIGFTDQSAHILKEIDQKSIIGWPLANKATYSLLSNNIQVARIAAEEAFLFLRSSGGYWFRVVVQIWATIGAEEGRYSEAAQLCGFVEKGFERAGESRQQLETAVYTLLVSLIEKGMSSEEAIVARRQGARWEEDEAAELIARRLIG